MLRLPIILMIVNLKYLINNGLVVYALVLYISKKIKGR